MKRVLLHLLPPLLFPKLLFLAASFCFSATLCLLKHFNTNLDIKKNVENLQKDNLCLFSERIKKYFLPPPSKQGEKHSGEEFSWIFFNHFSNMLEMCLQLWSSLSLLLPNVSFVLMIKWCISLTVFKWTYYCFDFYFFSFSTVVCTCSCLQSISNNLKQAAWMIQDYW